MLKKKYDEKCDVWSCGVILFILLTGEPPFNGDNDKEIIKSVEIGKYDLEPYPHISDEARSFIKLLLEYNPNSRITAFEALDHEWIRHLAPNNKLPRATAAKILANLKTFNADQKLQEATLSFIVNQLISKEEKGELKKVFVDLDTNNDGKLSFDEIVNGYKKIYASVNPEQDAQDIFNKVDADHNGFISYEGNIYYNNLEFIRATVDRTKILSDQKLESAFKLFDRNGDGFICAAEIKAVLGRDNAADDETWNAIVKEVDMNGDGEISLDEFKQMMLRILKTEDTR